MRKLKLNFKKLATGVFIGTVLAVIFTMQATTVLDFVFIRWEYIIPPIVAIYYLSIQPYLNYADAKTYFFSGAKIGAALALIILMINMIYEFGFYNQSRLREDFFGTLIMYGLFMGSYALVSGIGHYLFNKNVDEKPKDIFKNKYLSIAMLIGAFTFGLISLVTTALDTDPNVRFYELMIPVIIAAYIVVKSHNLNKKDFQNSITLGSLTGTVMGLVQLAILAILTLIQVLIAQANPNMAPNIGEDLLSIIIVVPLVVIILYTLLGASVGFGMRLLKNIL